MLWHIARRELADNLLTLRFPLAAALIIALFGVNALVFVGADSREQTSDYARRTGRAQEELKKRAASLNELAVKGPGRLHKRPSPLVFIAQGHNKKLPVSVNANARGGYGWGSKNFRYNWQGPWALRYPYQLRQTNALLKTFLEIDWAFTVGIVISFVTILFTYNTVCGEREDGTLRLTLSYPVPRDTLLLGKSLGAFLSVAVPTALGMVLSLLVILLSGRVVLDADAWTRIALVILFSVLYIALFVWLGVFISARCQRAATSLLALLFLWVMLVVLIPNTLGSVASELADIPSGKTFNQHLRQAIDEQPKPDGLYDASPSENPPKPEALDRWSKYLGNDKATFTRLTDAHLDDQFRQVDRTRTLMRISPAAVYQYVLESLSGTGFARHRAFVRAARQYRSRFIEFIKNTDRQDPGSPHVYPVKEGLSSKPVDVQNIPPFIDPVSLSHAVHQLALDAAILLILAILLFTCAYFSFLRYDPR